LTLPLFLFFLAGMAASVHGASISLNTGVAGAAPWQLVGAPGNTPVVITTPNGLWTTSLAPAKWVGASSTGAGGTGTYYYQLNIGSLFGSAGNFSFNYSSDNAIAWTMTNGTLAGAVQCGSGSPNATCFTSVYSLSGNFNADSVLKATVINGGGPTGMVVNGTASNVPEPSTTALLLTGGMLFGALRSRRVSERLAAWRSKR
jgi:hypothetical protein